MEPADEDGSAMPTLKIVTDPRRIHRSYLKEMKESGKPCSLERDRELDELYATWAEDHQHYRDE